MKTIFHQDQLGHRVRTRLFGGTLIGTLEVPERIRELREVAERCTDGILAPAPAPRDIIDELHEPGYLHFIEHAFPEWTRRFPDSLEMRPSLHRNHNLKRLPRDIVGRAGFYLTDSASVLLHDSWPAILASAATALDAARRVLDGEGAAYALCRPPGHHAFADAACGYCFLNNAGLAAALARRSGLRVSILDVDVHHGNGAQSLFYRSKDIQTVSVHSDPRDTFPFFTGYPDEIGEGEGEGFNVNVPVVFHSTDEAYLEGVRRAVEVVRGYAPDIVILALGLDASEHDPADAMNMSSEGFRRMGELTGSLRLPTVLVQEGGYPSPVLGANLQGYLEGFRSASGY
ncbi:histone deacetylase family protein [Mesorhizobium sp. 8]|jgi:acetoin utilization deacetylase AcuC-like enzyme|uniref:histone deacetylase family protein n=1 Tax=Mesorhizobium sp. 8 TaxID=2584466 RepID=UPI00112412C4|nr:histone deacetylase family protein [Mesorhizobium sp. 8]QDC02206.1 histone deacetylase family protein [Mesorhizobium sp. 8]